MPGQPGPRGSLSSTCSTWCSHRGLGTRVLASPVPPPPACCDPPGPEGSLRALPDKPLGPELTGGETGSEGLWGHCAGTTHSAWTGVRQGTHTAGLGRAHPWLPALPPLALQPRQLRGEQREEESSAQQ